MYIFEPILRELIWGGNTISRFKGLSRIEEGIGESWELSQIAGHSSVVANGAHKGETLETLMRIYGERLTGKNRLLSGCFPLLIKFIDAHEDLSIQVHPNDEMARLQHNSIGKTEMWYVIKAAPGAYLYSGFSRPIDVKEYVKLVQEDRLIEALHRYEVSEGDVFFLPAGRVHAIGAGCFIAEIQQTSDITYRIYDYGRKDANGKLRELHTDFAKCAIDFSFLPDYRTVYTPLRNQPVTLVSCSYFTTNLLDADRPMERPATTDSFRIYICISGKATLRSNKGEELPLRQGQTALIPAEIETVTLIPSPTAKVLETYV
jgi:mannose-6-phosphate isomerase